MNIYNPFVFSTHVKIVNPDNNIRMINLEKLVRPNIWALKPYSCARDEFKGELVYLDANEIHITDLTIDIPTQDNGL